MQVSVSGPLPLLEQGMSILYFSRGGIISPARAGAMIKIETEFSQCSVKEQIRSRVNCAR